MSGRKGRGELDEFGLTPAQRKVQENLMKKLSGDPDEVDSPPKQNVQGQSTNDSSESNKSTPATKVQPSVEEVLANLQGEWLNSMNNKISVENHVVTFRAPQKGYAPLAQHTLQQWRHTWRFDVWELDSLESAKDKMIWRFKAETVEWTRVVCKKEEEVENPFGPPKSRSMKYVPTPNADGGMLLARLCTPVLQSARPILRIPPRPSAKRRQPSATTVAIRRFRPIFDSGRLRRPQRGRLRCASAVQARGVPESEPVGGNHRLLRAVVVAAARRHARGLPRAGLQGAVPVRHWPGPRHPLALCMCAPWHDLASLGIAQRLPP
jgi:hypothetical protein